MFLRSQLRKKDGREHTYWSVVENQRLHDGRVVQRQVLYLGKVNDSQREAWRKGTRWDQILQILVTQRLLAPGSEWHLHRDWFERTALAGLLGGDFGLAEIHKLYCSEENPSQSHPPHPQSAK